MKRWSAAFFTSFMIVGMLGCCGVSPRAPKPPAETPVAAVDAGPPAEAERKSPPPLIVAPPIWMSGEEVLGACREGLDKAGEFRSQMKFS